MGTSFKIKYINFFTTILFVVVLVFGSHSQTIITVAGDGTTITTSGLQAVETGLYNPTGIFVLDNGDFYICDQGSFSIWKVEASSGLIKKEVYDDINVVYPYDLHVMDNGDIYFTDSFQGAVKKYTKSTGEISTIKTFPTGSNPLGIYVYNSFIYLAISANHTVIKIDLLGVVEVPVAGVAGTYGFNGDGYPAVSTYLYNPVDVCVDTDGNVYISDLFNYRIRKIDASTTFMSTIIGGLGSGFNGNDILATNAQVNFIDNIFVDNNGDLYFSDKGNNAVRKIEKSTGIVRNVVGNSTALGGFVDNVNVNDALLNQPLDVFVANNGEIYINDYQNKRIRKITCEAAEKPLIIHDYEQSELCSGDYITLYVSESNLNENLLWYWYESDLNCSEITAENLVFTGDTFGISLFENKRYLVRGEDACILKGDCAIFEVEVNECNDGFSNLVNSFSPNGDGVNDYFIIDEIDSNTTVIIYNRWGDEINIIENYDNVNNVWDGTNFYQESLPSGTYFYVIFYNEENVNPKSGWVQIVN